MAGAGVDKRLSFSGIEMIKKHFDLIVVALVVLSLIFYDLTMALMGEVAHLFFELLFELFEWFELGIEELIEHLFHTEHHTSQIITFYILLLIAAWAVYWLWQVVPQAYDFCKRCLVQAWLRRKTEWDYYWLTMTVTQKTTLLITALGIAYLASFFVM